MRWKAHFTPSRTIVCPALLPPWNRMTISAPSAMRSTTLPLPSSPHWAPTITMPGMPWVQSRDCLLPVGAGRLGGSPVGACRAAFPEPLVVRAPAPRPARGHRRRLRQHELAVLSVVVAVHPQRHAAHLVDPRHGAHADLGLELVAAEVRGQHHRPTVLVA